MDRKPEMGRIMYSFFDTLILPKVLCLLFRFGEYWILLGRRFINVVMHVPSFNSQQPVVCGQSQMGKECLAWGQLTVKLHDHNRAHIVHTLVCTWEDVLLQSLVAAVRWLILQRSYF